MKEYDVIVVGSGSGAIVVDQALAHGLRVALIEKDLPGGTCLNVGCIPSKILIFSADRIMEIQEAAKLGICANVERIDFQAIMERMRRKIKTAMEKNRRRLHEVPGLDFYNRSGHFVDRSVIEVDGERLEGRKFFLASGARPLIPSIAGLESVPYLTNETVLDLRKRPESLIIIGGGYIAAEYGHFFAAMGSRVTLLQRGERLVKEEEPEVSELLKVEMAKRMNVRTHTEVIEARRDADGCVVLTRSVDTGEILEFRAETILLAAGRKSNADLLEVEKGGVETDERGYIKVDEYFRTSNPDIWAFGDAIGKKMFRHTANLEAELVWHNAYHGGQNKVDFNTIPHAVFTHPQIASVGPRAAEAKQSHDVLIGKARYSEVAKGEAMMEDSGFAKIILEKDSWRILGFHIIGPYAPILIQEVVNAMASDGTAGSIINGVHIHPALSEVVQATLGNLREPD